MFAVKLVSALCCLMVKGSDAVVGLLRSEKAFGRKDKTRAGARPRRASRNGVAVSLPLSAGISDRHDKENHGTTDVNALEGMSNSKQASYCQDTSGWTAAQGGETCSDYQTDGFCTGGVVQGWASGAFYNFPEQNCCSCGKQATGPTPATPAPTPAPTEATPAPTSAPTHATPTPTLAPTEASFTWALTDVAATDGYGHAKDLQWTGQGGCWINGALGSRALAAGELFKWTVDGQGEFMGGLCLSTYTTGYQSVKFGLIAGGSSYNMGIYIIESGTYRNDPTPSYTDNRIWKIYADGDLLELRFANGAIEYVHEGSVVYTSAVSPSEFGSLYPCATFCTTGAGESMVSMKDPQISQAPPTPAPPTVCSVTDGSALSSSYPCACGTASCLSNHICNSSSNRCQVACSGYQCVQGWVNKSGKDSITCAANSCTDAECCDQETCSGYSCVSGWTNKSGMDNIICATSTCTDDECCDRVTCNGYVCVSNWTDKPLKGGIFCSADTCTDAECCVLVTSIVTRVTISTVVADSTQYDEWAAAKSLTPNCLMCSNQWPMYLSLHGGVGAGDALETLQSYLAWRRDDCSVNDMNDVILHTVGDSRGRALFVKDGVLRSQNGANVVEGTARIEIPTSLCQPTNVQQNCGDGCNRRRSSGQCDTRRRRNGDQCLAVLTCVGKHSSFLPGVSLSGATKNFDHESCPPHVDFGDDALSSIEWTMNSCEDAIYKASFTYGNMDADRPCNVWVNGIVVQSGLSFPDSGSWCTTSGTTQHISVNLIAGTNTIKLETVQNGPNIGDLILEETQPSGEYLLTGMDLTTCPIGTYSIYSSTACERAASAMGYDFMGAANFDMHPRGCGVDIDFKVTHNTIRSAGLPNSNEALLCARRNTCATHSCPYPLEHRPETDNIENPDDRTCCESVQNSASCFVSERCEQLVGADLLDKGHMIECMMTQKYNRNVSKCHSWYTCLYEQRAVARAWFGELLFLSADGEVPSGAATSFVESPRASCIDPSNIEAVENLNCNCVEHLHSSCSGKFDRLQCVKELACGAAMVCDSWKLAHCPTTTATSTETNTATSTTSTTTTSTSAITGGSLLDRSHFTKNAGLLQRSRGVYVQGAQGGGLDATVTDKCD